LRSGLRSRGETIGKKLLLAGVVLAACALRLAYLLDSHPFFDEYTTILAARAILQRGLPVLPSGLFYDHGLLFSYLDAPFVGIGSWLQGALGDKAFFALSRLPSLLVGVVGVALLYRVGQRWLSVRAGLVAAALLAFSPEGVVWGARARMYGLAQLLVLALAFLVYEGSRGRGSARLRWLALLVLLAALLTQLGAIILVPPLVIGALVVGWLTRPAGERPWFWRWEMAAEAAALAGAVGVGVLVKRLGQPLGAAPLGSPGAEDIGLEWLHTITYQASLALDGESLIKFLAREFGVPHHLWLAVLVVIGGLVALAVWTLGGSPLARAGATPAPAQERRLPKSNGPFVTLYLWLITALPVVEMVTLLDPWRRNPRYMVMVLPWFYLLAGAALEHILNLRPLAATGDYRCQRCFYHAIRNAQYAILETVFHAGRWLFIIALAVLQVRGLWLDLQVAFRTPEPAYEQAFRYVGEKWQSGDVVLTMNTCGAAILLGHADYFAAQENAGQFLLNQLPQGGNTPQPIDRWLGAPWLGTATDFNRVLDEHPRAWFVVDTVRLPVYYRGDWLAVLKTQMKLAWSEDDALVYRTRSDRNPLSMAPGVQVNARLGEVIRLVGYDDRATQSQLAPGGVYALTLFWSTAAPLAKDYTVFVHLRDATGATVAQQDAQPLGGDYPTSRWRVDEIVIDPHPITLPRNLPPGEYQVWVGMYRLDTMERLPVAGDESGENAIRLGSVVIRPDAVSERRN
jgi:4-amino-4-deoxy-L-arabinose transferase-like glycosyltransferase